MQRETGYEADTSPMQGAADPGRQIAAIHELAGLEVVNERSVGLIKNRLRPEQQAGGGFEGKPERDACPDPPVAAGELHFRQFADGYRVSDVMRAGRAWGRNQHLGLLKIFEPREDRVDGIRRPVFIDEAL